MAKSVLLVPSRIASSSKIFNFFLQTRLDGGDGDQQ